MIRNLAIMILAMLLMAACRQETEEPRVITVAPFALTAEEQQYIKDHRVVTWAAENNRPPTMYIDENGIIHGSVGEYLGLISKHTGLIFKPVPVHDIAEAVEAVRNGDIDLAATLTPSPARKEYLGFTAPYGDGPAVFLFRYAQMPRSPLRVGIKRGDGAREYVMNKFPKAQIVELDQDPDAIGLLERDSVDVVIMSEMSADYLLRKTGANLRKVRTAFRYQSSFGFSKNKKDSALLGSILSKAILSISPKDKQLINDAWKKEPKEA